MFEILPYIFACLWRFQQKIMLSFSRYILYIVFPLNICHIYVVVCIFLLFLFLNSCWRINNLDWIVFSVILVSLSTQLRDVLQNKKKRNVRIYYHNRIRIKWFSIFLLGWRELWKIVKTLENLFQT